MKAIFFSILLLCTSFFSFAQDSLKIVGEDIVQGDFQKSVNKCEKRLKKHPDDQDTYNKLAISYYKLADFKSAIATWDKLINLNANYPAALANRGICKYYIKDMDGTCEDFTRSVENGFDYEIMQGKKMINYINAHCQ